MATTYRRLYRSGSERMIGGVCGGLAEYFDIDPTLVRLLFVLAALFGGHGILAYLLMLIVIARGPQTASRASQGDGASS